MIKQDMHKGLKPHEVYNVDSLSMILGVQPSTIRNAVKNKKLKARKFFGRFFFLGKDVIESISEFGEPHNNPSDWKL